MAEGKGRVERRGGRERKGKEGGGRSGGGVGGGGGGEGREGRGRGGEGVGRWEGWGEEGDFQPPEALQKCCGSLQSSPESRGDPCIRRRPALLRHANLHLDRCVHQQPLLGATGNLLRRLLVTVRLQDDRVDFFPQRMWLFSSLQS